MLKIETFPLGMLECNCSIIACDEKKEAIIVDSCGEESNILQKNIEQVLMAKYLLHRTDQGYGFRVLTGLRP